MTADVSLGIPVYDSSAFLDELFGMLRGLDPVPREIVLLDDASRDDSHARLERFVAAEGARLPLRLLRNEANRGIAAAYNRLAAEARGEWMQLLDADDVLVERDYYARVAPLLDARHDLVVTAMTSNAAMLDRAARIGARGVPRHPPAWVPLLGSVATRSGVLYRRGPLVAHPFADPAYPGSDVIQLLSLRRRGNCAFTRHAHVRYRIHAQAQSSQRRDHTRYRQELARFGGMVRAAHGADLWLRELGQRAMR